MRLFNLESNSRRSPSQGFRRSRKYRPNLAQAQMDPRLALTGVAAGIVSPSTNVAEPLRVVSVVPIENPYANTPQVVDPEHSPAFSVQFNQPIDEASLGMSSFKLYQINPDGSSANFDDSQIQHLETINGSGSNANIVLVSFTTPLQPGEYGLVVDGGNILRGLDNKATSRVDQLVEVFAVGADAASMTPTRPMAQITQESTTTVFPVVNSDLDASLNELDLPEGTNWVISPDFGAADPDDYRIALFNAQKQLIHSAPGSKMLAFSEGLQTGQYFLQIYQTKGMGSDTAPTIRVTVSGTMPAPAAPVTNRVQPINQNGSDPNADALLLNLNGLDLNPASFDRVKPQFVLTDQAGIERNVTPSGYDPASNQLVVLLPDYLPTGHYSLRVNLPALGADSKPTVQEIGSFDNVFAKIGARSTGDHLRVAG